MKDPRLEKLARLLTEYSVALKPRDIVAIQGDACAAPLIRECYRAALRRGAFVITDLRIDGLAEVFMAEANQNQIKWVSPFAKFKLRHVDALISFWGEEEHQGPVQCRPETDGCGVLRAQTAQQDIHGPQRERRVEVGRDPMAVQRQCAGRRDVVDRVRGVRVRCRPSGRARPDRRVEAHLKGTAGVDRFPQQIARGPHRRGGHRHPLLMQGPQMDQLRRTLQFPRWRSVHGPGRDERRGTREIQFPSGPRRARSAWGAADVRARESGEGRGGQGPGFPARHDRDRTPARVTSARERLAQTTTSPATRRTRSSTKRSAAPSIWRWAQGTARPATETAAACTGTWSATCAKLANCTWTAT